MYLKELSEKVWKTKNARFVASKRMKRNRNSSTVSVALLSASIIAINMLVFFNITEKDKAIITIVTVVLSTFALVMSLLINHLRYEYREDNYHQCGIKLDKLNQHIRIRISELCSDKNKENETSSPKDDLKYWDEYYNILEKYNLNHSDFDYNYSLIKECRNDFSKWEYMCYWMRWNIFDANTLYWLIAIIPIIAVIMAFLYMPTNTIR